jgi:amphi-Trp domain-containing protein
MRRSRLSAICQRGATKEMRDRPTSPAAAVESKGTTMAKRSKTRDLEKSYSTSAFVAKLRRFADALEQDKAFVIQIAGERVRVPARAIFNIEHERSGGEEEIEFQIKWTSEAS